jgi:hypothetical protein
LTLASDVWRGNEQGLAGAFAELTYEELKRRLLAALSAMPQE